MKQLVATTRKTFRTKFSVWSYYFGWEVIFQIFELLESSMLIDGWLTALCIRPLIVRQLIGPEKKRLWWRMPFISNEKCLQIGMFGVGKLIKCLESYTVGSVCRLSIYTTLKWRNPKTTQIPQPNGQSNKLTTNECFSLIEFNRFDLSFSTFFLRAALHFPINTYDTKQWNVVCTQHATDWSTLFRQ